MHPHGEFLIMQAVLKHILRDAGRAEIVHNMNCMSKQDVSMFWQAVFIT